MEVKLTDIEKKKFELYHNIYNIIYNQNVSNLHINFRLKKSFLSENKLHCCTIITRSLYTNMLPLTICV